MDVKVSVIIPVYNVEAYLDECLKSVTSQTLKEIEIICVNDGSTDRSGEILDSWAKTDDRIKVITQKNGGLSSARNTGLNNISGEYVYFLDSDDYIESTLLERAIEVFNNYDIDYFCFGSEAFCEDKCIQSLDDMNNYIKVKQNGLFSLNFNIGLNMNIQVWNKIFKVRKIDEYKIKFIEKLLYEDIYFTWYYFFVSKKAYFDDKIYHHYRVRSTSIMETTLKNKLFKNGVDHLYNWHELMLSLSSNADLFRKNYDNLLYLLNQYTNRTKETVSVANENDVELLKIKYVGELAKIKDDISKKRFGWIFSSVFSRFFS